MATDYSTGGADFEIDVTAAQIQGKTDKNGDPIFLYYASVRRKKPEGQPFDPWKDILDVGGKRPHFSSSDARALDVAKEWLDNNGHAVP